MFFCSSAYVVGSLIYPYFDLKDIDQSTILSFVPTFHSFFDLTVNAYGADWGQRFFTITILFMITFILQNIFTIILGFIDGANFSIHFHKWKITEIISILIMLAAFYAFFSYLVSR